MTDIASQLPPCVAPAFALSWSEDALSRTDLPALALWRPAGRSVALGLSQSAEAEADVDALRRDGLTLIRRQSGGGAVMLLPGVLCWEAWAREEDVAATEGDGGIRPSYRFLTSPVRAGLAELGVTAFQAGISDLSIQDGAVARKIAGTAQLRRRGKVLVHGSLLVHLDMSALETYLRFPSAQPEYRAGRSHLDFCRRLSDLGPEDCDDDELMLRVSRAIVSAVDEAGWSRPTLPEDLSPTATDLLYRKYTNDDWNWRKIRPTD